jgi:hypothetical protein
MALHRSGYAQQQAEDERHRAAIAAQAPPDSEREDAPVVETEAPKEIQPSESNNSIPVQTHSTSFSAGIKADAIADGDLLGLTKILRDELRPENIPAELKAIKGWVVWQITEIDTTSGKFDKVPYWPGRGETRKGTQGGALDRANLGTFDEANAAFKQNAAYAGIGLALLPDFNLVAFDPDHCLVEGKIASAVAKLMNGTYAEVSPSGTGARAFWIGAAENTSNGGLELYSKKQFVTVTGQVVENTYQLIGYGLPPFEGEVASAVTAACTPPAMDRKPRAAATLGSDFWRNVNQAALDHLDEWVPSLFVQARKTGQGGWRVSSKSLGRKLEEDISIHPDGIKDFGVHDMGDERQGGRTAIDLVMEWHPECKAAKLAAQWLCSEMGINQADLGWKDAPLTNGSRDALDEARRAHQMAENERIGEGDFIVPAAQIITLEQAVGRFVFLSDGSRVWDSFAPHYDLTYPDFAATYAASKMWVPQPPITYKDGTSKGQADKEVLVAQLWRASVHRKTAVCRTFKADGGLFLLDPEGRPSVNSWRPFDRSLVVTDDERLLVTMFLDHIEFLFPDANDRGRFLDWLAHIEQQPGVLPHTAWLHIARGFGLGRNWLASVLTRVWAGSVAANFDLASTLKSGFNGRLSRKVLAVVDEIREGGRDTQWEHSEKMKGLITEETRMINPKFGRQSVEYNSCRWLMLSNHLSAIPLEQGDRRVEVVVIDSAPRPPDHYAKLYNALGDAKFIASVAAYLGERDTSNFNPGAWATDSTSKKAVTSANRTPMAENCELLVAHWPSDLISTTDLFEVLTGKDSMMCKGESLDAAHRRTLEKYKVEPLGRTVKIDAKPTRLHVIRNKTKWREADAEAIRKEIGKRPTVKNDKEAVDTALALLLKVASENDEYPSLF